MKDFRIPLKILDLQERSNEFYYVEDVTDCKHISQGEIEDMLTEIRGAVVDSKEPLGIVQQKIYDQCFSLSKFINYFDESLEAEYVSILKKAISRFIHLYLSTDATGHLKVDTNTDPSIRIAFKMYLSLVLLNISHLIVKINSKNDIVDTGKRKKKITSSANTDETKTYNLIYDLVSKMNDMVDNNFWVLWPVSIPEETVLSGICNVIYQIYENEILLKSNDVTSIVNHILVILINKFDSIHASCSASLFNILYNKENVSNEVVKILDECITKFNDHRLAGELLREIGRYSLNGSNDSKGIKNISNFIIECSNVIPSDLQNNLSVILYHLNNENYTIRNAIISSIGNIIIYLRSLKEDNNQKQNNGETSGETEKRSVTNTDNTRDSLFELLEERVYDVNSFVRTNTIKTFNNLLTQNSIPLSLIPNISGLCVDRLNDKSSNVRKESLKLLILLLEINPFGCSLDIKLYDNKYKQLKEEIEKIDKEREENKMEIEENEGDGSEEQQQESNEIIQKRKEYKYLSTLMQYLSILNDMPKVLDKLLQSDVDSDILQGIDFINKSYEKNISYAESYIHRLLPLIFSENDKIIEKIINLISTIYIYDDNNKYQSCDDIANNLIKLSYNNNIEEEMSLENIIEGLVRNNHLNDKVINSLYNIIISNDSSFKNISYALHIIYIIAVEKPKSIYIKDKLEKYIKGIDEYMVNIKKINSDIFNIGKYYCKLMSIIYQNNELDDDELKTIYLIIENLLFSNININSYYNEWFNYCETAISTIREISCEPDKLYTKYIINFSQQLLTNKTNNSNYLSQLYHLIGCVSLNTFIYCDSIIRIIKQKQSNNDNNNKNKKKKKKDKKNKNRKSKGGKNNNKDEEEDVEEEEENDDDDDDLQAMIGSNGSNDNELYDQILTSISNETLLYENLISTFKPLLFKIIYNKDEKYNSIILQRTCILCLCKLMVISEKFCKENIQLLFTLLLQSKDTTIKCNIIISMGDLVFRYPNILEQYTSSIYSGLKDQNERVRRNTLIVLTHLILNDMIKVKGQISDIALLLEDDVERIQIYTQILFNELSKRGKNPIYNLLPDIVSRLTNDKSIKHEVFKKIMSYLISFIKKDNQNDNICEKLCHRINATEDKDQWICLSYCLTLLQFNETNIKKLFELNNFYKEAIKVDEVYENFEVIFSKVVKSSKNENVEVIKNYLNELSELHDGKRIDSNSSNMSPIKKKRAQRKKRENNNNNNNTNTRRKRNTKRKNVKSKRVMEDDDDDDDVLESDTDLSDDLDIIDEESD